MAKAKNEKQAKGLYAGVGDYKGNTLNLNKKELGKAGVKAAKSRTVNISDTKYDATKKKVFGPKGQALTGKVDLGGGNIAVYKNGVRVRAQKPKPSGGGDGGSTLNRPTAKTSRVTPQKRDEGLSKKVGNRKATSGTVTSAIAQGKAGGKGSGNGTAPYKRGEGLKGVQRATSGFVRGTGAAGRKATYKGTPGSEIARLKEKRATDTRNQGRDAAAIAALATLPLVVGTGAGGAAAGAAARGAAAVGRGAVTRIPGVRGIAKAGDIIGQGAKEGVQAAGKSMSSAGRATATAAKATAKTAKAKPRPGQVGGARTSRDIRNAQTKARSEAAKKGAATRKANAAKKTAAPSVKKTTAKKTTAKKK